MKRKRLDRDIWTTITKKRYIQKIGRFEGVGSFNDFGGVGGFSGIASLLYLDEVSSPSVWNFSGSPTEVCATGMKWLQLIPDNEKYMVTAMMCSDNTVNVWYVDIIYRYGLCEDGVAYFDDLYLDIVSRPGEDCFIDDMDELEGAYEQGVITQEQYDTAIQTKDRLVNNILPERKRLHNSCMLILAILEDPESK